MASTPIPGLTETEFFIFLLVLVRMTGLFIVAPIFGHASIPRQVKIGLAFACTLIVYPMVRGAQYSAPTDVFGLASAVAHELLIGAVIGYVALLVFAAAQLAGEVIDTQIGFSMANLVDPTFGSQVSLIGQFQYLVATVVYLAVDGHHQLLGAIMHSFQMIPLGGAVFGPKVFEMIVVRFADLFSIAVRMSIPMVACLLITEFALGVLARSVPQMNVLMVGFPLKILVGLVVMGIALPPFVGYLHTVLGGLTDVIWALMKAF